MLGISLVAVLAASPMMARADNELTAAITLIGSEQEELETDANVATAGYVKGAYNAAFTDITSINNAITKLNGNVDTTGSVLKAIKDTAGTGTYNASTNYAAGTIGHAIKNAVSVSATSAGAGLTKNEETGQFSVNVDDTTVEISGNNVAIKASGVDTTQLKDAAVKTAKIDAKAVTTEKIDDAAVTGTQLAGDAVTTDKIADGTIVVADVNNSALAKGEKAGAENTKLATKGYVDEAASTLEWGIEATIGESSIPVMTTWGTTNTANVKINAADYTTTKEVGAVEEEDEGDGPELPQ